jgi:lipid A 3-O-deacylase
VKVKLILFLCFWVIGSPSFGQLPQAVSGDRCIRFNYDNDYFSATDRYYTQGVRLEWIAPVIQKSFVCKGLIKPKEHTALYYGAALERDGFTPEGIRHIGIYYGERPYAGVMFLSHFAIALNNEKTFRLFSQLDLGIIGPAVGGKEEQTGIHKAIGNLEPLGWEYQIANDAVVNYTLQYDKGLIVSRYAELIGMSQLRAGTLYDDAAAGLMIRTGLLSSYFDNIGLSKQHPKRIFQCYGMAKGMGKFVGYNGTMQGGAFNKSSVYRIPSSDLSRLVAIGSYGLVIAYKNVSLEYTKVFISPEFKGGLIHGWGHCNIAVVF